MKEWEADGSLLQRAREADQQAQQAAELAAQDGVTHLAPHEINEIYGGPDPKLPRTRSKSLRWPTDSGKEPDNLKFPTT